MTNLVKSTLCSFPASRGASPLFAALMVLALLPYSSASAQAPPVPSLALPAAAQWRTGYFMQREAAGQTAATIPWSKYTHVIHSALRPTYSNGACGLDTTEGLLSAAYIEDFVNAAHAAGVKPIIGIRQDDTFEAITACTAPQNIEQFVDRIRTFVTSTGYDGVDLDWENNIITPQYQDLIRRLRTALPTAILSVVVGFADRFMTAAVQYDLDQINIRAYDLASQDLTGSAINYTWYHSPTLRGANIQDQAMDVLSSYYVSAGNASSKLGLAVPFYGRIQNACLNETGTNGVTEPNQAWVGRAEIRSIPYRDLVNSTYWSLGARVWDDSRSSQYIQYRNGTCATDAFVPYVGPEQLQAVAALIKGNRLGGIATHALPYEYMAQQVGDARYPLSTALYDAMIEPYTEPVTTTRPHTTVTQAAATSSALTRISRIGAQTTPRSLGAPSSATSTSNAAASTGQTFTYYVDSVNGLDSNPGTLAEPWKTIAKVNSTTLAPGQSVGFASGDVWRETLTPSSSGTALSPITFGAYGSGAEPIITGANLLSSWTSYSANVWQASVTTQPNQVFFNGVLGIPVAGIGNIKSATDWYWASNVLSVYSPSAGNPAAYYTSPGVEASQRGPVILTNNNSYITINGLDVTKSNGHGISAGPTSSIGVTIQNSTIEQSAYWGIELKGSTTAQNAIVDNCTVQNNGEWGIAVDASYTGASQISNNTLTNDGLLSVVNNQEYSSIEGRLGNFNIFGNTISATAPNGCKNSGNLGDYCHGLYYSAGFGGDQTVVANVYNNTSYGNSYGAGLKFVGSANAYNNTIYGNNGSGIMVGQNGAVNVVYLLYGNLIYSNDLDNADDGIVEQSMGAGTISLTVIGNTLYQNGNTSQQEFKITDNLTVLTVENNLLFATPTRRTMSIATQRGTVVIDYNLQWRADGNPSIIYNGAVMTWAAWQALGFDKHGVNANPLLTNPGARVFTLQPSSPAIGVGVYIPGVSNAKPPNIGAK